MRSLIRNRILLIIASIIAIISISCNNSNSSKNDKESSIMVFAAASLTNVLSEIVDSFETKYSIQVKINLASSGTLARQIVQGGKPDVYLSANKRWTNYIDSLGFVKQNLMQEIAQNNLVLIVPKNSSVNSVIIDSLLVLQTILGTDLLSMGDPKHVPAGIYAKQALDYYGFNESVNKKILPTKDVRTALMMVEMNESPLGIVFSTDAKCSSKVKIIGTFPDKSHKSIKYMAATCSVKKEAKLFYEYLNSDETKAIWTKFGFRK